MDKAQNGVQRAELAWLLESCRGELEAAIDDALEAIERGEMRQRAAVFDRLLAVLAEKHVGEADRLAASPEMRQRERIERLLDGEAVDASDLAYDCDAHHLGVVVSGEDAPERLQDLAVALDRRLLQVPCGEHVWAWLGGGDRLDPARLQHLLGDPPRLTAGIGEPGDGPEGWRLTNRQALAALSVAERSHDSVVRYRDIALTAAVLGNDLAGTSLHEVFLAPLEAEPGGGRALETLAAYFAANRNATAAAEDLGISRQTVNGRLRTIEQRLGRPVNSCTIELELALRARDLKEEPRSPS